MQRRSRLSQFVLFAMAVAVVLWSVEALCCTSIMVGRKASTDGSVMTSHTCDSHDNGSEMLIYPAEKHKPGDQLTVTKWEGDNTGPMKRIVRKPIGQIPQVAETYGYVGAIYGIMNQHQLAIGESTFGGRDDLVSQKGLIDCDNLTRLMLQRAKTARDAIRIGGELIEKYGWIDVGEALTIADTQEVWLMEIVGPGKDQVGAVWAAQRIPDDHVSVVANGARICELDLKNSDYFMASKNVFELAEKRGYWEPKGGKPFRFCEAYNPDGRFAVAVTRREWRALDLLAPSLKLHPNQNYFPISVKPEKPVGPEKVMELFRDTFEGTDFDLTKDLTVVDATGKAQKSALANPFPPYDLVKMMRLNTANNWYGERCMARFFCIYATVTQSRAWLPDPVGGIVWLGYGNPAMSTYVPIYAGVTDLPEDVKTDGHTTGFSRRSAWWAFKRVATIAAHRWGDMRVDVTAVRTPLQERFLSEQRAVAERASQLLKEDPVKAQAFLTQKTAESFQQAVSAYWNLGDLLWNKYDEQW